MSLIPAKPKVLIVSGGYLSAKDDNLWVLLKKQIAQYTLAQDSWLEAKVKLGFAEPLLSGALELRKAKRKMPSELQKFFDSTENLSTPELTEVVLATELRDAGLDFEILTYDDLFRRPKHAKTLMDRCEVTFASSTFLRDLSELMPLVNTLWRSGKKLIVGGALAGSLCHDWEGSPKVDVLAIGYGEMLIPALAKWIHSGFSVLAPPEGGRLVNKAHTQFMYSGVPATLNLDHLTRPDWALVEKYHGEDFSLIHYESVRGCPYRCAFCNYPFLFDDFKFRTKSARRMAEDWAFYKKELGVKYIGCLDSLFTMPKSRLIDFCNELLARNVDVKWFCYARADDLADLQVVELMKRAGCIQVQIGVESGDRQQLLNMSKGASIEDTAKGLQNCRKAGLTSVATLVVGFPGETESSLEATFQFLKANPPDFYFLCIFSTRVPGVPVLSKANREKFGLVTDDNAHTISPYWTHRTMSCADVGVQVRRLNRRLVDEKVSLDAALFYKSVLKFTPSLWEQLLDFQYRSQQRKWLRLVFDWIHFWVDWNLKRKVRRRFGLA